MFEIEAGVLYLKAGSVLDHDSNPVPDVTVDVDDVTVGATPDDAVDLVVNIVGGQVYVRENISGIIPFLVRRVHY
jgi:hypothetical protein